MSSTLRSRIAIRLILVPSNRYRRSGVQEWSKIEGLWKEKDKVRTPVFGLKKDKFGIKLNFLKREEREREIASNY